MSGARIFSFLCISQKSAYFTANGLIEAERMADHCLGGTYMAIPECLMFHKWQQQWTPDQAIFHVATIGSADDCVCVCRLEDAPALCIFTISALLFSLRHGCEALKTAFETGRLMASTTITQTIAKDRLCYFYFRAHLRSRRLWKGFSCKQVHP